MKLKLFPSVIILVILVGCSSKPTSTNAPPTETQSPPTSTPVTVQELATPIPSATATIVPTATEIMPGAVLFEQNFEGGEPRNFIYRSDGWIMNTEPNGNMVFEIDTNTETAIKNDIGGGIGFGSKDWTNYSAEYRVKLLNKKATVWMNFRSTIGNNEAYYVEWLNAEFQTLSLHVNLNFGPWVNLKGIDYPVLVERWYRVKVEALGSKLRVYIDDNLILKAEDANIASGGFELGITSGTHAQFDDIRVIALEEIP